MRFALLRDRAAIVNFQSQLDSSHPLRNRAARKCDHIDAHFLDLLSLQPLRFFLEVTFHRAFHAVEFSEGQALERAFSGAFARTVPDLDEYECLILDKDEIDFPHSEIHISSDEFETSSRKKARGLILINRPDLAFSLWRFKERTRRKLRTRRAIE